MIWLWAISNYLIGRFEIQIFQLLELVADQKQIIILDIAYPFLLPIKHSIKLISEHEIKNLISFFQIGTATNQKCERPLGNTRMFIIFLGIFNLVDVIYKPINWLKFFYFHAKLTINNNILKNIM